jgi:hypothetical protein
VANPARQFLRITLGGIGYLLPSAASIAIEQREVLAKGAGGSAPAAYRETRSGRWPAYGLDGALNPGVQPDWERAVFLHASPLPIGIAADDVQLVPPQAGIDVVPFTPVGRPPASGMHLFDAARVDGERPELVFSVAGLVAYLQSLGVAS